MLRLAVQSWGGGETVVSGCRQFSYNVSIEVGMIHHQSCNEDGDYIIITSLEIYTVIHNADHHSFASEALYPGWQNLHIQPRLPSTLTHIVLGGEGY